MKEKKKQKFLFGCLISFASFIILLVVLQLIKITPTDVFTDPQYHFSLKYPEYWGYQIHPQNNPLVLVQFFPPDSSEEDKFHDNVTITIVDLATMPRLMNIDRFTSVNIKQLTAAFGDYVNVTESKQIRVSGLSAYRFAYVTQEATAISGTHLKYLYVWFIRGRYAYVIAFLAEVDAYQESIEDVNRLIRTFKFSKK